MPEPISGVSGVNWSMPTPEIIPGRRKPIVTESDFLAALRWAEEQLDRLTAPKGRQREFMTVHDWRYHFAVLTVDGKTLHCVAKDKDGTVMDEFAIRH